VSVVIGEGPESSELRVADVMDPLPARLALHHSVAAARELMYAAGFSFLVVVAPSTGKLLGVVLRRALERNCESRGHDPEECPLVRHVYTDIDFCLEGELLREVFGSAATAIDPGPPTQRTREARRRNAIPVIVVDGNKVPVGLLSRGRATTR
jgi:CBS domain-containing protein